MAACYRLKLSAQWAQTNCGHIQIGTRLSHLIPLYRMRSDKILAQFFFNQNYEAHIPTREERDHNNIRLNDDVVCFTDDSRINDQSGASIFNSTDKEQLFYPLGELCSVFQAEVYAILQCARLEGLHSRSNSSIAICSDSQAALKALSAAKVTSALVAKTMAALKELAVFNSVRLVWVPGHNGIPGNEKADVLANQASLTHYIGPEPVLGVSSTTVRNALRQWSVLEQYRLWCID